MRCQIGHVRIERVPPELRREFSGATPFQWRLRVERGKGSKARWVPCDELALSLQTYRLAFGLPQARDDTLPLLRSGRRSRWGQRKGLRDRTAVWNPVTGLCDEALAYEKTHRHRVDTNRFEAASSHWLRHASAKGLVAAVCNRLDAQAALEDMGRTNLRTLHQYVDDEPLKRALATRWARFRRVSRHWIPDISQKGR